MSSTPHRLRGIQTSHPGAEPWGGIAGPAPLSPAAGGLKSVQIHPDTYLNLWKAAVAPVGPLGESPALLAAAAGLAMEGAKGKLLSLELDFLLVQGLSDLLVTE